MTGQMHDMPSYPRSETPWKKLNTLLATRQNDIFNREKDNGRHIYLYDNGTHWIAFEKSAWQLCKLFHKHDISILRIKTYPFPIVMASVPANDIQAYFHRHIVRALDKDHKILRASLLPAEEYNQWHRNIVNGLL